MNCLKQERKGRFLIQEVEEKDIIDYEKNETEKTILIKAKRHYSNNLFNKFTHIEKGNSNVNLQKKDFHCVILDNNTQKYVDSNNIWEELSKNCKSLNEKNLNLFKYYPKKEIISEDFGKNQCDSTFIEESQNEISFISNKIGTSCESVFNNLNLQEVENLSFSIIPKKLNFKESFVIENLCNIEYSHC